jgi:hypothetical protein
VVERQLPKLLKPSITTGTISPAHSAPRANFQYPPLAQAITWSGPVQSHADSVAQKKRRKAAPLEKETTLRCYTSIVQTKILFNKNNT